MGHLLFALVRVQPRDEQLCEHIVKLTEIHSVYIVNQRDTTRGWLTIEHHTFSSIEKDIRNARYLFNDYLALLHTITGERITWTVTEKPNC